MNAPSRYAVVLGPDATSAARASGRHAYAACVIDGDSASCHLMRTRAEVHALVGEMPCAPSRYGSGAALPSFEAEAEALALLQDELDEAAARNTPARFPDGFVPAMPRMEGGLSARLTDYGLDVSVSLGLATALGWREGDGVVLGVSPCSGLLAVAKGPGGATLVRDISEPDTLQLDRDLSGVPLGIRLGETSWTKPQYQALDGSIVLAASDLLHAPALEPAHAVPAAVSAPAPHAGFSAMRQMLLVAACAAASAGGSLLARFWL